MQLPAAQNLLVCKADLQNLAQLNKLWILNWVYTQKKDHLWFMGKAEKNVVSQASKPEVTPTDLL